MCITRSPRTPVTPALTRAAGVLALLVGLLGMHGLAAPAGFATERHPAPAPPAAATAPLDPHAPGHRAGRAGPPDHPEERREDHRQGGVDHATHVGPSCLAPGVVGGPELPVPGPAPLSGTGGQAAPAHANLAPAGEADRAPPDLAALSVLRI
ncbi:DUF6153 family protein [Allostreptomyces psammosilenae]|uniref:Uncharacterized protein n=1 Tax=Allostreptomyces psammosilenae TaxID=1892865 RepID=A0A852ZNA1_9ACTN|nr:DUF6153 family protein [Allostreptomyces psammosilenae]NYI03926.1 hypothetical protein [Allostreptomyces psammosilenae]